MNDASIDCRYRANITRRCRDALVAVDSLYLRIFAISPLYTGNAARNRGKMATQTAGTDQKQVEASTTPIPSSNDTPPRRTFRSFIWDTDTHLKSPAEKRLLLKLDASILTIGCLGFFMKYLDQGNLSNAYVSGMQEQLSMYGNEYTYAQTMYTVAYAVMQIPSTLIIQKIRPSIWLAVMEVAWGAFTFAQAGIQNVPELYAFRFLVGLFESSFFPALLYLLGSWYTKTELAKRVALFHMTAPLGTAFGGYLQAAVYENLNGAHGIEGWRWLYIVCGCMTVPVGLATFVVLPDTPYTTKVWFLSAEERELAIERVRRAGKAAPVKIRLATFKTILSSWKWYGFVIGYVVGSRCFYVDGYANSYSYMDRHAAQTGTLPSGSSQRTSLSPNAM